ncbi:hypothetical protein EVAR_56009_1 [Eumeta japonica]|uniref:Uncharacterized protein n=1 Tax=Eumeta variegata TaxID=151549 RepID=A0A4C1YY07_EUMVA|nr:hypothetical protein EVAR_56009_1 [Eumeta japonica]
MRRPAVCAPAATARALDGRIQSSSQGRGDHTYEVRSGLALIHINTIVRQRFHGERVNEIVNFCVRSKPASYGGIGRRSGGGRRARRASERRPYKKFAYVNGPRAPLAIGPYSTGGAGAGARPPKR